MVTWLLRCVTEKVSGQIEIYYHMDASLIIELSRLLLGAFNQT